MLALRFSELQVEGEAPFDLELLEIRNFIKEGWIANADRLLLKWNKGWESILRYYGINH